MEESKTPQVPAEITTSPRKFSTIRKHAKLLVMVGILLLGTAGFLGYTVWQKRSADAANENSLNRQELSGVRDINTISIQLGPEEYVAGPTNAQDAAYFTRQDNRGRWHGFTGNSSSFVTPLDEKTLLPITPLPHNKDNIPEHRVILKPDTAVGRNVDDPKHPDACGAWIAGSIYKDTKNAEHWYGWYHAERNCLRGDREGGERTHMSIAYTESFDGGNTWKKPNYPNNRIITADTAFNGNSARDDTGAPRIIQIKDHFYIFYQSDSTQESVVGRRIHLARSKVADLGKPGTWKKWYCSDPKIRSTCGFTQPGIGGKSSKLTNSDELKNADGTSDKTWKSKYVLNDRYIIYNRYLNRYIAMGNDSGSFKLIASDGDDFTNWRIKSELMQVMPTDRDDFTVDNWNNGGTPDKCRKKVGDRLVETNFECKQWYGYNSITGFQGASNTSGKNFYMYYNKHFPGQEFKDAYIMRRQVTLFAGSTDTKTARTELSLYRNAKGNERITSELPEPWLGYERKARVGYVLSNPAPGYEPLFECKKPDGTYYTMRLTGASDYMLPVPGDPPTQCNAKDKLIRRVGWVSPQKIEGEATAPIYDVSANPAETRRGSLIGWALRGL